MPKKYRSAIRCAVKETDPVFLITDAVFFIGVHFTKEALDGFKAKYPTHEIKKIGGFLMDMHKWSLELALVDSTKSFTSYANLELRLVIHDFDLASDSKQELENKHPTNLFRDDECRTFIQQFLYSQQQAVLKDKCKAFDFTDASTSLVQSIDASQTKGEFKDYQFLKRTQTEVLPATAVKGGKKRANARPVEVEEDLTKMAKVQVKKQTTIDLKKGKVSTKVIK